MINSGGGGVNYQTQIVTKLPNENNPNLLTTNDWFWGEGGGKLPNANCDFIFKLDMWNL